MRNRPALALLAAATAAGLASLTACASEPGSTAPAATPVAAPPRTDESTGTLDRYALTALQTLGHQPDDNFVGGFGPNTATSSSWRYGHGDQTTGLAAGSYLLRAVCVGQGSTNLAWSIGGGTSTITSVPCTQDAAAVGTRIDLAGKEQISIEITPDGTAADHSGIAYTLVRQ